MKPSETLMDYLTILATIQCHFCGEGKDQTHENQFKSASDFFFAKGWREVTSRKYQVTAAACPNCAKLKDKDR